MENAWMTTVKRRSELRPQVRELIAALRVGDRLPSERELGESWNVARMTVRRALDEFLMEGVIERRHGSGTFVAPRPFVKALGLTSFSEDMKDRGLVPGSRLVSLATIKADAKVAKELKTPLNTPVYRFTRLRLGSGEPLAVETVWMRMSLVPGLSEYDLDGSLYKTLADRYRIVVAAATVTIRPVLPDQRVRELLKIGPEQSCLLIQMISTDAKGTVLMAASCTYRGDKYQLSAEVSGAAFARTNVGRVMPS
jgi:GntR family transcriptional regulator|tara:strand:- start:293 stop:1051 length:759 start_codon:yes stop_codon:yes gene_type:complete